MGFNYNGMITGGGSNDKVPLYKQIKDGDSTWAIAEKYLKSQDHGKKVSNADIVAEMDRLAKLNNYDSVEEFNAKAFGANRKPSDAIILDYVKPDLSDRPGATKWFR